MTGRAGLLRRAAATVLVAVYALAVPAALAAGWIRTTVVSSNGYASAVAHLAEDPAVRTAVRDLVHAEVASTVERVLDDVAPSALGFLTGALGDRTAGLVDGIVDDFMASAEFQRRWTEAHAAAHRQLLEVLDGSSSTITIAGDDVVLDLAPLLDAALAHAADRLTDLVGRPIEAPTLDTVPAAACELIAERTPADLPADCGRIPLFPASALADARFGFGILRDGTLALVALPPLAAVAALVAAPRRRTLVQLGVAGAATVLAALGAAAWLRSDLTGRTPRFQPVVDATVDALTEHVFASAQWYAAGSLAVALVVALSGVGWRRPSRTPGGARLVGRQD